MISKKSLVPVLDKSIILTITAPNDNAKSISVQCVWGGGRLCPPNNTGTSELSDLPTPCPPWCKRVCRFYPYCADLWNNTFSSSRHIVPAATFLRYIFLFFTLELSFDIKFDMVASFQFKLRHFIFPSIVSKKYLSKEEEFSVHILHIFFSEVALYRGATGAARAPGQAKTTITRRHAAAAASMFYFVKSR